MTPTMPRWYERANEASFKPVEGGYVFQAPSPWIFARPSYYLVSDAKKAEISARLGRWRLLLLMVGPAILCLMLPVILFPSTIGRLFLPLYQQLGTGLFAPFLFTVLMLLMAPAYRCAANLSGPRSPAAACGCAAHGGADQAC